MACSGWGEGVCGDCASQRGGVERRQHATVEGEAAGRMMLGGGALARYGLHAIRKGGASLRPSKGCAASGRGSKVQQACNSKEWLCRGGHAPPQQRRWAF